jgi:PTH1 family peptidyl-tRNA hydrolase
VARLVVGLGNPGPEYAESRHNAGFMVVDLLGENLRAAYWKDEAGAKVAQVRLGDDDLILAKPQAFMNVSGKAVRRLLDAYGIPVAEVVIVHDDLDLPAGAVRAKKGGGHGGHTGLRSLSDDLGSGDYLRVRVGIGRPPGRQDPADYVLESMRKAALEEFAAVLPVAAQCVMHVLEDGIDSAMQEFNGVD